MAQLRQRYAEFQAAGVEIVVIGMGTPAQTRAYIAAEGLLFPLLSDPRRVAHRAYGVLRGTLRQLALSPRVWLHGVTASAAGHKQTAAIGDTAHSPARSSLTGAASSAWPTGPRTPATIPRPIRCWPLSPGSRRARRIFPEPHRAARPIFWRSGDRRSLVGVSPIIAGVRASDRRSPLPNIGL